jgi:hypothetical protein
VLLAKVWHRETTWLKSYYTPGRISFSLPNFVFWPFCDENSVLGLLARCHYAAITLVPAWLQNFAVYRTNPH